MCQNAELESDYALIYFDFNYALYLLLHISLMILELFDYRNLVMVKLN